MFLRIHKDKKARILEADVVEVLFELDGREGHTIGDVKVCTIDNYEGEDISVMFDTSYEVNGPCLVVLGYDYPGIIFTREDDE